MSNQDLSTVSVIIAAHNGEKFLAETIDTVLGQTYPHYEIIVVDDGSTDTTEKIVRKYPNVRYLFQKNQGVCLARNRGFYESNGDYIVFLDQDDRLLPDALEIGVNNLKAHPDYGCVVGRLLVIDPKGNKLGQRILKKSGNYDLPESVDYQTLLSGYTLGPPAAVMFRRHVLQAVSGFDPFSPPNTEDLELYLRVARQFSIYFHNQLVFEHRRHPENTSQDPLITLSSCLATLDLQSQHIQGNHSYEIALRTGKKRWKKFFYRTIPYVVVGYLKQKKIGKAWQLLLIGLRHSPQSFIEYVLYYPLRKLVSE